MADQVQLRLRQNPPAARSSAAATEGKTQVCSQCRAGDGVGSGRSWLNVQRTVEKLASQMFRKRFDLTIVGGRRGEGGDGQRVHFFILHPRTPNLNPCRA